ncbi:uncharacterized protein [Aegilops tauschii subsp. strangulata]|uniref:uncharacterized protein isoform X1 n=1 Tax=Aegilops tauschii subsp. strangulata TaxID=200361 RepID=UPI003CC8CF92
MSTAARWRKTSSGMDLVTVESEHKTRRPALNCDFTWFLAAVSWSCSAHLCPPNSPSMPAVRSCTAHCSKLECPSSARRPRVTPLPAPVLPNVATPMTARIVAVCLQFLEVMYMHMPASDLFSWSRSCRSYVHDCADGFYHPC